MFVPRVRLASLLTLALLGGGTTAAQPQGNPEPSTPAQQAQIVTAQGGQVEAWRRQYPYVSIVDRLEHLTVRGKKPKFLGTMDTIESAYDAARAARRAVPLGWTTCVRDADTNELVRDPRDEAFWAKVAKDGLEK